MLKRIPNAIWFALFATVLCGIGGSVWYSSAQPTHRLAPGPAGNRSSEPRTADAAKAEADDRIALYTLWLALFTGALVLVSGLQIFFLIKADRTARISADAARAAAEATRASVEQMKDSAVRQLRAYLNINAAKILHPFDRDKRAAEVEIKNFGQTPSHDDTIWISTVVREHPLRYSKLPDNPPPGFQMSKESLPPGRTSLMEIPIGPLNGREEAMLMEGEAAIYVSGLIRYKDVFGIERTTKFRLICNPEGFETGRLGNDANSNEAT